MICPDCKQNFDGDSGSCPRCGRVKGIVKTSTILISAGEVRNVYRSVEEVPDHLKGQLIRCTNGTNSATIVIADRQGRKEIAKAIRNLPASKPDAAESPAAAPLDKFRPTVLHLIGALLVLAAVALVWLIFR